MADMSIKVDLVLTPRARAFVNAMRRRRLVVCALYGACFGASVADSATNGLRWTGALAMAISLIACVVHIAGNDLPPESQ